MPTPITASLMEEIRLAVRHGAPAEVDLAYFQRLVRAGADPQAAFGALCDPLLPYCDAARARVAQWLVSLPAVQPLDEPGFAQALRKARGQDFFQVCVQGLARRGANGARNVLHALMIDAPITEAVATLGAVVHVLTPFPEVSRAWLRQTDPMQAGGTPAHLMWREAAAALAQTQQRLRDHPLLMSGSLQACTLALAHGGADYSQADGTGRSVFDLVRQANMAGLGEVGAPPWGTWNDLLILLERFNLHMATEAAPARKGPGPRL